MTLVCSSSPISAKHAGDFEMLADFRADRNHRFVNVRQLRQVEADFGEKSEIRFVAFALGDVSKQHRDKISTGRTAGKRINVKDVVHGNDIGFKSDRFARPRHLTVLLCPLRFEVGYEFKNGFSNRIN